MNKTFPRTNYTAIFSPDSETHLPGVSALTLCPFIFLKTCLLLFWFSLDKYQDPTKTVLSLPLPNWTGERKYDESLWVEIRTGRDHSSITVMDKTH